MEKTKTNKKSAARKTASSSFTKEENQSMLQEFFVDELRDIYWAEKHLVKALPKLQKASSNEALANAFADHLSVTQDQVSKLEQVFEMLGEKPRGKKCEAMEGLVKESESIMEDTEDGSATRDVALIMAGQKVEHYEIATYGGLTQLAKTLGYDDIAEILGEILEEEKEADGKLTTLAENNINQQAEEEVEEK